MIQEVTHCAEFGDRASNSAEDTDPDPTRLINSATRSVTSVIQARSP